MYIIYIYECGFLSDWHFAINAFSSLSIKAGISPTGLCLS